MHSPSIVTPSKATVLPAISIGMPVYNAEGTLRAVLESILAQTFRDFELIVSDNASTDGTDAICTRFAALDNRIRYVRQPLNLGAEANFRFVLQQAAAEYFMWAASDDLRSADFLAVNLQFLRTHPEHVGSTSPVRFTGGTYDDISMGDSSLEADEPHRRVLDFFGKWHANGRYYSLFRRTAVLEWSHLTDSSFLGSDWTLVTHLASIGKLHRSDQGWVELGRGGFSNSSDIFSHYRRTVWDWILPFRRLSIDTLNKVSNAPLRVRIQVLRRLMRLNYSAFKEQLRMQRRTRSR